VPATVHKQQKKFPGMDSHDAKSFILPGKKRRIMGNRLSASTGIILKIALKGIVIYLMTACLSLMIGCAAVDQSINFLYQPTAFGKGGSGDIYLSQSFHPSSGRPTAQWVIGKTKNSADKDSGNILTARSPADIAMDAFSQELKASGYNVITVDDLPVGVAKGIRLASVEIRMEEFDRLYKVDAKCTVKVSVEPWRNGSAVKRLDYESSYSDSTLLDREMILLKSLQNALQELMARAVREAVVLVEQK
jgi:hypothetical protein